MASSPPSFSISDHDIPQSDSGGLGSEDTSDSSQGNSDIKLPLPPPPIRSSLSVPTPIKSSIGINNPAQAGLFPLPNSQQTVGDKRNKVALAKGCSLMDWIRLTKSGKDLTGVGGPKVGGKVREVTRQELRKHRKRKDAWMALNGAVYNVTHYMDYHPGGWDELVKGAGRDATDMFNEIHKWVNYQSLLEACLVGKLVDGPVVPVPAIIEKPFLPPPPVLPPILSKPPSPTMDFFQTDGAITINIYTKRKGMSKDNIILDNTGEIIRIVVLLPEKEAFVVLIQLQMEVDLSSVLRVGPNSGKVEVDLTKCKPCRWQGLGVPLEHHLWFGPVSDLPITYRYWTVSSTTSITPDTRHIVLDPPQGTIFTVPTGHHVHIKTEVEGMEISRSYTPVTLLNHIPAVTPHDSLHLLVKIYPDGALTPQLGKLSNGDKLSVSDHTGSFSLAKLSGCQHFYLLAAGTGCTPIFSLLNQLSLMKPLPVTTKLLFFNKTQTDIIWWKQLSDYQACHPWLSVVHVLSEEGEEWKGDRGRVRKELLDQYLGQEEGGKFAAVCGPSGFTLEADRLLKDEFQYLEEQIHLFQG